MTTKREKLYKAGVFNTVFNIMPAITLTIFITMFLFFVLNIKYDFTNYQHIISAIIIFAFTFKGIINEDIISELNKAAYEQKNEIDKLKSEIKTINTLSKFNNP